MRHGAKKGTFEFGFELSYGSFDTILAALCLSAWDTNVLKTGVTRNSFCIERYFADNTTGNYHRLLGSEFNTLKLTASTNGIVKGSIGGIFQDLVIASAAIASSTYNDAATTSPFDSFIATGSLEEGGSSIAVVSELSLDLSNGLEPFYAMFGKGLTMRPTVGRSKLTGSLTARFEDETLLEKFLDETESSITLTLADAATNELEISLPRIKYTGGTPDVGGEGPVTIALPFEALYDSDDESNIVFTRTPAA